MKFRSMRLGAKLTAIILSVTGVSIVFALGVFTFVQMRDARITLQNSAVTQGRLMALYAEVPLQFDDPQTIVDILSRADLPALRQAIVFNRENKEYASFQRIKAALPRVPDRGRLLAVGGALIEGDTLYVYLPIGQDRNLLGFLYMNVSLQSLRTDVQEKFVLMAAMSVFLLIFCFVLAQWLQRYISLPILRLSSLMQSIGRTRDYSTRAVVRGDDEITSLSRSFNHMLDIISEREVERDLAENALRDSKQHLETAVQELQYLANYDSLTELPNRALCMDRITGAVQRASRENHKVAVIFLDLDHFKEVNDSLGHAIGDELLMAASRRLQSCIRRGDTLSRLGGDEFVIMLEDLNDDLSVSTVMQKAIDAFSPAFQVGGYSLTITVSLGACLYPVDGNDVATLMQNADAAMYRAKEKGRNNFQFYQSDMNSMSLRRLSMVNDLRDALNNGQLQLFYQPQLNTQTRQIVGVEALLRWHHPQLGAISPVEFIPIAETSGLIVSIGLWVMQTAAKQLAHWRNLGHENLRMAVNLSAVQFRQPDLAEQIVIVMNDFNLPPHCIELELTESMLMRDVDSAIAQMQRLKDFGFRLAIDDFGIGFSSLNYLRKFPLDVLKIDRSFVDEVTTDDEDKAITLAILSLAKNLHLDVIAEGVETTAQYDFLRDNQCDELQGYLFSAAVSANAIGQLLGRPMALPAV